MFTTPTILLLIAGTLILIVSAIPQLWSQFNLIGFLIRNVASSEINENANPGSDQEYDARQLFVWFAMICIAAAAKSTDSKFYSVAGLYCAFMAVLYIPFTQTFFKVAIPGIFVVLFGFLFATGELHGFNDFLRCMIALVFGYSLSKRLKPRAKLLHITAIAGFFWYVKRFVERSDYGEPALWASFTIPCLITAYDLLVKRLLRQEASPQPEAVSQAGRG